MSKGIIYYTSNDIDSDILETAQMTIYDSGLPIWSASLKPIQFGENEVISGQRSYPTMVRQIVSCLERATTDVVFFCEHDVLYNWSHFRFDPPDDRYYYNMNSWRWEYPNDKLIHYDGLTSLSQMCVYREKALDHFKSRLAAISTLDPSVMEGHEPEVFRKWGYEPGRKKTRNGGFSDEEGGEFTSKYPNIDIRHGKTFSSPKTTLGQFKHLPTGWQEKKLDDMDGWTLREMFDIWN